MTQLDGVNKFVFTLAEGLATLGNHVQIFASLPVGIADSEVEVYSKRFFDVEGHIEFHSCFKSPRSGEVAEDGIFWLLKGSKLINRSNVDAAIISGIVPIRTKAVRIAVNHGIYEILWRKKYPQRMAYWQIAKYLYKHWIDMTVSVSLKQKAEFEKFMGVRSLAISLPVKLHLYKSEPLQRREPLVIHVGTRPMKNLELSIRVIKFMVESMKQDVKLVVIGPRNTYVEKLMLVHRNMVPKHLIFLPNADASTVKVFLSRARALLLPSKYEASSYVVLEAQASGLPTVVSDAIPQDVVMDGFNGFRISSFERPDYVARLANLLSNDTLWRDISRNALETAKRHSHTSIAKQYENLIAGYSETKSSKTFASLP